MEMLQRLVKGLLTNRGGKSQRAPILC